MKLQSIPNDGSRKVVEKPCPIGHGKEFHLAGCSPNHDAGPSDMYWYVILVNISHPWIYMEQKKVTSLCILFFVYVCLLPNIGNTCYVACDRFWRICGQKIAKGLNQNICSVLESSRFLFSNRVVSLLWNASENFMSSWDVRRICVCSFFSCVSVQNLETTSKFWQIITDQNIGIIRPVDLRETLGSNTFNSDFSGEWTSISK
jgi:hypothetical protein